MCSPVRGCEIQILKRRLLGLHATEVVAGIDGDIPCVSFVCGLTQDDIAANTERLHLTTIRIASRTLLAVPLSESVKSQILVCRDGAGSRYRLLVYLGINLQSSNPPRGVKGSSESQPEPVRINRAARLVFLCSRNAFIEATHSVTESSTAHAQTAMDNITLVLYAARRNGVANSVWGVVGRTYCIVLVCAMLPRALICGTSVEQPYAFDYSLASSHGL